MKKFPRWCRTFTLPLLLILVMGSPAGAQDEGEEDQVERRVERQRIVLRGAAPRVRFHTGASRGYLGVELTNLTPELRAHFGVPEDIGVMLGRVAEDSPAEAAALEVGDIITRIDGEDVGSDRELARAIARLDTGTEIEIEYWRAGRATSTRATLAKREAGFAPPPGFAVDIDPEDLAVLEALDLEIAPEILSRVQESLRKTFESEEWEAKMEALRELNLEKLDERMQEVQERLEELEHRLEEKYRRKDDGM